MAIIFIQTFGCSLNYADSEVMAGLLAEAGHILTEDPAKADLIVINSCTVKNEAEAKLWRTIKNNPGKKIVVAGCVPMAQQPYLETRLQSISVIGTNNVQDVLKAVQETLRGNVYHNLKPSRQPRLHLPHLRKNPVVEIIPINKGCLDSCTYCKTKQARGHLQSYPLEDIKQQMRHALAEGVKEIWLTSQDTGCYGLDGNSSIIELLKELLSLRGYFRIRLGMMNPNYALQYLEELKECYQHPKLFKFLHIPVQSGNDQVLRSMQRRYCAEAFAKVVREMRQAVPRITISTDIIVAFPGETARAFQDTLALVKQTHPEVINLSRYWARPGTPAAQEKQITGKVSKERSIQLGNVFRALQRQQNQSWVGWKGDVLIDEIGPKGSMIGRNDWYKQVVFTQNKLALGTRKTVRIVEGKQYDLRPG